MKPLIETVLFSIPLKDVDGYQTALIADRDSSEFSESHRAAGATRVMTWIHRDPDYAIIRWDGSNVLDSVAKTATTRDPFMARWRGIIRVYSGDDGAGSVWDSSRHQVFSWGTGEEGSDTDLRVFHGSSQVHDFLTLLADISNTDALARLYDRIRRSQGVTRVEIWHQRLLNEEVVMRMVEGNGLDAAFVEVDEESAEFDRRINELARAALSPNATTRSQAELIVDWRA
jgi:hypothetical protein